MTTFKEFIIEGAGEKMAIRMAHKLLGAIPDEVTHVPQQVLQGAKHHAHKFVDTATGPWVVTHFKNGESEFVKVDPPKGSNKHSQYFVPRGGEIKEGAVKRTVEDAIERAIAVAKKKGLDDNYQLALTQIAETIRKDPDAAALVKDSTNRTLRNLIKGYYEESDHKASGKGNKFESVFEEVGPFYEAAHAANFIGRTFSSRMFSYDTTTKTFTAEASSIRGFDKQVWNDSADIGFAIKSHKTGDDVIFTMHKEHKDRENDVTHWEFHVYNPKRDPKLNGLKATIFND